MRVCTSRFTILLADYGIDNLLAGSGVSPAAFKSLYPIHVFDVSKESERLTEGDVNLTISMLSLSVIECSNLKAMDQR